jgi:hypothetical protein
MISNRKYKQYIKLKFDIETPIGGVLAEGSDDEILTQRLYGKAFQSAGLGFTDSWATKPKANEVRETVLEESWSLRIYDPQTADERYYTLGSRYEMGEKAEEILEDLGFEVSVVDTSKEIQRPESDSWIPTKLFIDGKIAEEHGLYYIYKWNHSEDIEDWANDFHIRTDPDNRNGDDLNIYAFSVHTEVNDDDKWTSIQITMTCSANKASTFTDADDKLQEFVAWVRGIIMTAIPHCTSSISCRGEVEIERDIACTKFVDEEEEE